MLNQYRLSKTIYQNLVVIQPKMELHQLMLKTAEQLWIKTAKSCSLSFFVYFYFQFIFLFFFFGAYYKHLLQFISRWREECFNNCFSEYHFQLLNYRVVTKKKRQIQRYFQSFFFFSFFVNKDFNYWSWVILFKYNSSTVLPMDVKVALYPWHIVDATV